MLLRSPSHEVLYLLVLLEEEVPAALDVFAVLHKGGKAEILADGAPRLVDKRQQVRDEPRLWLCCELGGTGKEARMNELEKSMVLDHCAFLGIQGYM